MQKPYLTYALDNNGKLVHVDSVLTGLACMCVCPHCKSKLVAKNGGRLNIHHFAHVSGSDCVGAVESALHKMAKAVLQENKIIKVPPIHEGGTGKQIVFKNVEIEEYDKELSLRPDCVGYTEDGRTIWVEFKRTHEVDVYKAGKIISAKNDCVEVDLNTCDQDPAKVRFFIENSCEKRKWIYNHETPLIYHYYERNNYVLSPRVGSGYKSEQRMARHFAVDEQNTIINLNNLDGFDANMHKYYCIACGKEVYVDVDDWGYYSFFHTDEKTPCEDDYYLHEATKKVIFRNFKAQHKFDVFIPQSHLCENRDQCSIFNNNYCSKEIPVSYDLKAYGYDSCEIDYTFPDEQYPCDVVLKRGDELETAIVIVIDAYTCHIQPENLKRRTIEVSVRYERQVFDLYENLELGKHAGYLNFRTNTLNTTSIEIINRKVLKFMLFSSGKYYIGTVSCISTNKKSAIYEMIISKGTDNYIAIRQFAVLRCYNMKKLLCLCEICSYLRHPYNILYNECICIRYKRKGTPRNPLESMPIKCQYFTLDKTLKAKLEKELHGLEFIEKDLS